MKSRIITLYCIICGNDITNDKKYTCTRCRRQVCAGCMGNMLCKICLSSQVKQIKEVEQDDEPDPVSCIHLDCPWNDLGLCYSPCEQQESSN